jgi:hypothetical protein
MTAFRVLALGVALAATASAACADDMTTGGLTGLDLYNHFREQGVTIVSPPTQPVTLIAPNRAYDGHPMGPDATSAVLLQTGDGHPCDYTLGFDRPVRSVSFNRSSLHAGAGGVTHPYWTVVAFGDEDRPIASVGELRIRSRHDVPARHFTLNGPGITRLVFWSDGKGAGEVCNVVVDSLYAQAW